MNHEKIEEYLKTISNIKWSCVFMGEKGYYFIVIDGDKFCEFSSVDVRNGKELDKMISYKFKLNVNGKKPSKQTESQIVN